MAGCFTTIKGCGKTKPTASKRMRLCKRTRLCKRKFRFKSQIVFFQCLWDSAKEMRSDKMDIHGAKIKVPINPDICFGLQNFDVHSTPFLSITPLLLLSAKVHHASIFVMSMISEPNTFKCFHYTDRSEHPSKFKSLALRH